MSSGQVHLKCMDYTVDSAPGVILFSCSTGDECYLLHCPLRVRVKWANQRYYMRKRRQQESGSGKCGLLESRIFFLPIFFLSNHHNILPAGRILSTAIFSFLTLILNYLIYEFESLGPNPSAPAHARLKQWGWYFLCVFLNASQANCHIL